jgi:hypothetical protein
LVQKIPALNHQNIDGSEVSDCRFNSFGGGFPLTDIAINENQAG